eukprot:s183_g29.t1
MDASQYRFVVATTDGVARAFAIPLFITEGQMQRLDMSPFLMTQKDEIVEQLMKAQTRPQLRANLEQVGLSARGHSKTAKPDLAGLMADKLIENLIPNEDETATRERHFTMAMSAYILSESLEKDDGQEDFKKIIREVISKGSSSEDWQNTDGFALGLLEIGRQDIPDLMEEEYQSLLQKKNKAEGKGGEPETEPDAVPKKDFPLNDLEKKRHIVSIRVVGRDDTFKFGFDPDDHFDLLFEALAKQGISAGGVRDEADLVVKNSRGSLAEDIDVISAWVNDEGILELSPYLAGGAKGVVKRPLQKKKPAFAEVQKQAMELAQKVSPSTRLAVADLGEVEGIVSQIWADNVSDPVKTFENRLMMLPKEYLEKMASVIATNAGGDTDYKVRCASHFFYDEAFTKIKALRDELDTAVSVCEMAMASNYLKCQEANPSFKLATLREMVKKYYERSVGAEDAML